MFHYTDSEGHKAISSQPTWLFKAQKPPGPHPVGAYFTTLGPDAPNLAARLRIPRAKLEFVFSFTGDQGLKSLAGGRGAYVFWSPQDYEVEPSRQVYNGKPEDVP